MIMRRILVAVLAMSMIVLLGCSQITNEVAQTSSAIAQTDNVPQETEVPIVLEPLCDGKVLKVFAIGNSFSNNATQYLYDIAKAEGIEDILIGRLYIGGCSLSTHVKTFQNEAADYTYYKNDSGKWMEQGKSTLLAALTDEEWDIITMQQASGFSGMTDTYSEDLDLLVDYVNVNKTNPDAKLVWHMTWAYQSDSEHKSFVNYDCDQMTMYSKICDAVKEKVLTRNDFVAVIPAGTAIQNARSGYFGDNLTSDGFHLNQIGQFIAAYTWYCTFVGRGVAEIALDAIPGSITLSEENKAAIKNAVNDALRMPFEVTTVNISK